MEELAVHNTAALDPEQRDQYTQALRSVAQLRNVPAIVTYQDIQGKGMLNYSGGMKIPHTVAHFGQRKLFLSELHFLTGYLKRRAAKLGMVPAKPILVVYPGAAPSKHTGYLAHLFPEVTFLLVDPTAFRVKLHPHNAAIVDLTALAPTTTTQSPVGLSETRESSICTDADWFGVVSEISLNSKIYTLNGMFTDPLAQALTSHFSSTADIVLISDIRTNTAANIPDDLDTCWNLAQQFLWVKILNPTAYLLKFRYPYYVDTRRGEEATTTAFVDRFNKCAGEQMFVNTFSAALQEGLDVVGDYAAQRVHYLPGTLDIQAFPGQSSTELRLSNLDYHHDHALIDYPDWKTYESEMCMFNKVWRPLMLHRNPYANRELGFDHCNDCALEALFWEEYLTYRKIHLTVSNVRKHVLTLHRYSCGPLSVQHHGYWFGDYQAILDRLVDQDQTSKRSKADLTATSSKV